MKGLSAHQPATVYQLITAHRISDNKNKHTKINRTTKMHKTDFQHHPRHLTWNLTKNRNLTRRFKAQTSIKRLRGRFGYPYRSQKSITRTGTATHFSPLAPSPLLLFLDAPNPFFLPFFLFLFLFQIAASVFKPFFCFFFQSNGAVLSFSKRRRLECFKTPSGLGFAYLTWMLHLIYITQIQNLTFLIQFPIYLFYVHFILI